MKMKKIIDFNDFIKIEYLEDYINSNNFTDVKILNLKKIGDGFLYGNKKLINFSAPNLKIIGNYFLFCNKTLRKFSAPNLEIIGDDFLYANETLENFRAPNLKIIGECFLYHNENFTIYDITTKLQTVAEKDTVVYKKMKNGAVIELLLKKGTRFQISKSKKARAEFLYAINDVDYNSSYDKDFKKTNKSGEKIEPDFFDKKYEECSNGIHFFFEKEDAKNY